MAVGVDTLILLCSHSRAMDDRFLTTNARMFAAPAAHPLAKKNHASAPLLTGASLE